MPNFDQAALRKAFEKLDWERVLRVLENCDLPPEILAKNVITEVIRSGCLILRYRTAPSQTQRDSFRASLENWITPLASPTDLNRLRNHLEEAPTIEEMFALVMRDSTNAEISQLDPATQAWAVIDRAIREYEVMMGRLHQSMATKAPGILLMDAVAPKVKDSEGNEFSIDSVIENLAHSVATTIQMLAKIHRWPRKCTLPQRSEPTQDDCYRAGTHFYLANVWSRLLSASEHLRFNEERLTSRMLTFEDGVERKVTTFQLELTTDIVFRIARVRAHQIQLQMTSDLSVRVDASVFKNPRLGPVSPAPEEYISRQEVIAVSLLDELYHQDVMSQNLLAGLTLREWVRCFATLVWFVKSSDEGLPDPSLVQLSKEDLLAAFVNGGVEEAHAEVFIKAATFTPDSRDLYDCPLLSTDGGHFYLIGFLVGAGNLLETVVSRLVTQNIHDTSKGDAFEIAVLGTLRDAGLQATSLSWNIGNEEYQCDAALLLDEHLFVFECKNDLLPTDSAAQEFFFLEMQGEHAQQALRISESLKAHPELIKEKFGRDAVFHKTTTIVLNAMPFSVDGKKLGVYFHDFSSLARFVGEPNIYFSQQLMREGKPRLIKHKIASLWDADQPTATAFLKHLEAPTGFVVEKSRWRRDASLIGLTDEWAFMTPILKRQSTSFESFLLLHGWSEEKAKDFGAFLTAVADRVQSK